MNNSLCRALYCDVTVCRYSGDVPDEGGGRVHGAHAGAGAGGGAALRRPGPRGRGGAQHAARHVPRAAAHHAQGVPRAQGDSLLYRYYRLKRGTSRRD